MNFSNTTLITPDLGWYYNNMSQCQDVCESCAKAALDTSRTTKVLVTTAFLIMVLMRWKEPDNKDTLGDNIALIIIGVCIIYWITGGLY